MTTKELEKELMTLGESNLRFIIADIWNQYAKEQFEKHPLTCELECVRENTEYTWITYNDNVWYILSNINEYNPIDDFFSWTNGEINSYDKLTSPYSPVQFDELAEWILNNPQVLAENGLKIEDKRIIMM